MISCKQWIGLQYESISMGGKSMIREIDDEKGLIQSVEVIRQAFGTVARDFHLTEANCPSNPAFINIDKLKKAGKEKGAKFFGLFIDNRQAGFVAIEKANESLFYMERLAVLPEYRHAGYGKKLMDFVCDYVKKENGAKVSIGIMNENRILKKWYQDYGFIEMEIKEFQHLPFTVCFMEKNVSG